MTGSFQTFQKFSDIRLAEAVAKKFQELQIEFVIENKIPIVDPIIIGTSSEPPIHLHVRISDFDRANRALEEYYQPILNDVDPDYYLLSFSDRELLDVVNQPDQWGHFDRALAKKLLLEGV